MPLTAVRLDHVRGTVTNDHEVDAGPLQRLEVNVTRD